MVMTFLNFYRDMFLYNQGSDPVPVPDPATRDKIELKSLEMRGKITGNER